LTPDNLPMLRPDHEADQDPAGKADWVRSRHWLKLPSTSALHQNPFALSPTPVAHARMPQAVVLASPSG
jgi:hypothetical protein